MCVGVTSGANVKLWILTWRATRAGADCHVGTVSQNSCAYALTYLSQVRYALSCREFAEETLGLFGNCSVTAAGVQLAADLMYHQLCAKTNVLHVKHQLRHGAYHMFVALLPHVEPLMFHLATQQNLLTGAIEGAEKSAFAW